jgi:hypothetical protein
MIKSYLIKVGEELKEHGGVKEVYRTIFTKLIDFKIKNAVLILNDNALYFENNDVKALVEVERKNVGAAKILLRKIAKRAKKVDLSSIEEVFEFAEELERMNLDGITRFLR